MHGCTYQSTTLAGEELPATAAARWEAVVTEGTCVALRSRCSRSHMRTVQSCRTERSMSLSRRPGRRRCCLGWCRQRRSYRRTTLAAAMEVARVAVVKVAAMVAAMRAVAKAAVVTAAVKVAVATVVEAVVDGPPPWRWD